MKRYYNNAEDEEFDFEEGQQNGENEIEIDGDLLEALNLDLAENHIRKEVLEISIKMCEKSFLWSFYRQSTKVKKIKQVYHRFLYMIFGKQED
jgi:hypothetical protein